MAGSSPRERVRAAVERYGEQDFVLRCMKLLDGDVEHSFVEVVGGDGAPHVLSGHEGGPNGYWPRTWALRALLYAWDEAAEPAVIAATADDHWRVREMAAKVIATRSLAADSALERLATDGNARVRAAAARAQ